VLNLYNALRARWPERDRTGARLYGRLLRRRHSAVVGCLAVASLTLLAACSKPAEQSVEIRPVRTIALASASAASVSEFPGEIKPRVESRLGFRVGGKIVERRVDAGAMVKRGQVLMRLDPADLQLQTAQAAAAVQAARSSLELARAELTRYQELEQKNFVSRAVLDAKEMAFRSAQASHEQALAGLRTQSNQATYANLVADMDGVVIAIDAEAGQVVAAGTPVVRVAGQGEREVAISIPENSIDTLRQASDIQVRVWADPGQSYRGVLRELAPAADPLTRTYAARISIPEAPAQVRLGMSATVRLVLQTPQALPRVPLSALYAYQGGSALWVVEDGVVNPVPIQMAGTEGNDILIASGVTPGQTIVTAGVNQLKPGQRVRVMSEPEQGGERTVAADAGVRK